MKCVTTLSLACLLGAAVGCGTQPAALLVGDGTGSLDVLLDGNVATNINLNLDTNVTADVFCTLDCNLNTGQCETVCDLAPGTPPTPEALGALIYAANCAACHGDPPGTGFAPNLTGKSAQRIADEFADPDHPGGAFPHLTQEDIDNLAAYLVSP